MSGPMGPMGITVVGLVAGTHLLEDIKVAIPHKVAVPITAHQMLHSKDLYRALNQGFIFKLDGGAVGPAPPATGREGNSAAVAKLEKENKELKRQVQEMVRKNNGLQQALEGMNTHLDGVLASLGRLESRPMTAATAAAPFTLEQLVEALMARGGLSVTASGQVAASEAVGGDVPMFIAEEIKPKDAETNIKVLKTAQESSVTDAAKALKELRKKDAG